MRSILDRKNLSMSFRSVGWLEVTWVQLFLTSTLFYSFDLDIEVCSKHHTSVQIFYFVGHVFSSSNKFIIGHACHVNVSCIYFYPKFDHINDINEQSKSFTLKEERAYQFSSLWRLISNHIYVTTSIQSVELD